MKVRKRYVFLGILLVLLIGVRLALPYVIRDQANKKIATLPDYEGHIGKVHLALWRGAFAVKDFHLRHKDGQLGIDVASAELSVLWPHLFHKAFVGAVRIVEPRFEMVVKSPAKAPDEAKEKGKEAKETFEQRTGKTIPEAIQELIPFRVDRFEVVDGSVVLRETARNADKNDRAPAQAPFLTDLDILITNLTNSTRISDSLVANGHITGKITDTGHMDLKLRIDPVAEQPRFDITIEIQKFQLSALNQLLEWQTGLHFNKGTFALYSEASAANGRFKGYVKPLVQDLEARTTGDKQGILQKAKQVVINVGSVVFSNKKTDQIATRVPFEGEFEDPKAGVWSAVLALLRNAFIESIKPGLDPGVSVGGGKS